MRSPFRIIYPSAWIVVVAGCSNDVVIDDSCFVNLAPITARSNVVAVGDTLTFDADLGPAKCLPAGITSEDWRWSSSDTLVARIDSLAGLAVGVSPGQVSILVEHADAPSVASSAALQVVPQ